MIRTRAFASLVVLAALTAGGAAQAEILLEDTAAVAHAEYYAHPALRSLVFVSREARSQAILPPAPTFVAPPPLIWRAPGVTPLTPPPTVIGFNRSGSPSNRDLAAYSVARAHAFSQEQYRRDATISGSSLWWYGVGSGGWVWLGSPPAGLWLAPAYPPPAPGSSHPSNRDNAAYLIDRAHRFSQDAYRRP